MTTRFLPLCVALTLALGAGPARAQTSDRADDITAAYLLVLGRAPTPAEVAAANAPSIGALISTLKETLGKDAALAKATLVKSYLDAFGRAPTAAEMTAQSGARDTYTELMQQHVATLAANPVEYGQVIQRAYPLVVNRDAYPEEIQYWKKQGTLPFVLIVGGVEAWARRNQPGLMVTTGAATIPPHSEFLTIARLSPASAEAARKAAGLAADSGPVIAAGADKLASIGHMIVVVAGGPNLGA